MDNEKKRRPRIVKSTDTPLEERTKSESSENTFENEKDFDSKDDSSRNLNTEQKPFDRTEKPLFERKPYDDRGGYDRKPQDDRGGYDRKPYDNRGGYDRKPYDDRGGYDRKPYDNRGGYDRKPYDDRGGYDRKPQDDRGGYDRKPQDDRGGYDRKPYDDRGGYDRKPQDDRGGYDRKPYDDRGGYDRKPQDDRGGYDRKPYDDRGGYGRKPYDDRGGYERKPYQDRGGYDRKPQDDRGGYDRKPYGGGGYDRKPYGGGGGGYDRKPYGGGGGYDRKPYGGGGGGFNKKPYGRKPMGRAEEFHVDILPKAVLPSGEGMPLNKFLAHCGVASRRKAVELIESGKVTVNGETIKEPYYRYQIGDKVICDGTNLTIQERMIYLLMNKPKNIITTTEDEHGRPTVLDIVDPHIPERVYPVGRLDRDTTGLIVITNDGELAQKLTHPSHHVQKQYRAGLDHPLNQNDLERIARGIELNDGPVNVSWIRYAEDHPGRDVVELEITEGRNHIVRRIFESLGYDVRKLDRFYFAGLTKKDLPRGKFRELTQREIIMLKHFTGHPKSEKQAAIPSDEGVDTDGGNEGENE